MVLSEREQRSMSYGDKMKYAERHEEGGDKRKAVIREAEKKGNAVMGCRDIKECLQAKEHLESQGKQVRIVGGTSKPFVFFK